METTTVQQELFLRLKQMLPSHVSLAAELCDLLGLSADSVYRRIRGEKPITIDELKKICEHYKLSLDQLLQLKTESVLFNAPGLNGSPNDFADYMRAMLVQFKYFNSFKEKEIFYLCKDAPIWYFYLFPELAAFKTFFWSKTINNQSELAGKKFSIAAFPYTDCFNIGQQVLEEHNKINSVELWNLESIHSTINQIAYYRDAGIFESDEDLNVVVVSFHQWLDHLELQAEKGCKFMPGAGDAGHRSILQFYINELILGNNTMVIKLDNKELSMVTYSVFHYLFTDDIRFSAKAMISFNTLLGRSALISKTGEKERIRFFNILREKVNALKK
jgi:transcriptional regulator with XRE-family HTH domain